MRQKAIVNVNMNMYVVNLFIYFKSHLKKSLY